MNARFPAFNAALRSRGLSRRAVLPEDREFLHRVYASTREAELAVVPWSREEKDRFLSMQFEAQRREYGRRYAGDDFSVLYLGEEPIGRLYIGWWAEEVRLIDIALLPEFRNRGLGSAILEWVQKHAAERSLPLTIHVEVFNPALRLYRRLGFRVRTEGEVYHLLEWAPREE